MTKLDDEAKAELLTFLVVGQLFAFARSGEWLRTDHLIKSSQMWLSSNGAACDWLECIGPGCLDTVLGLRRPV